MRTSVKNSLRILFVLGFAFYSPFQSSESIAKDRFVTRQRDRCHAFCNEQHSVVKGWTGPDRASMDEAQKDADAHNKQYDDGKGDVGVLCE